MNKVEKYIDYVTTKIRQFLKQRTFVSKNQNVSLKYMLEKNRSSRILIVVFSACTRKGVKARYNYVRTLKDVKENKLFILDDFSADHRGAYYLGQNGGNEIELACQELIMQKAEELRAKKIILCGSSKGGWAALNLMTDIKDADAIVGAPQYYLANYLLAPPLKICREFIMPDVTEQKIKRLNEYLRNKLKKKAGDKHKIYLHYSDSEHTYNEHVRFLIEDLESFGYDVAFDCRHYTEHWDVSRYFPDYLLDSLTGCCKGE